MVAKNAESTVTDPQGRSPETQTGNSSDVEFIIDSQFTQCSQHALNTSVVHVSFVTSQLVNSRQTGGGTTRQ